MGKQDNYQYEGGNKVTLTKEDGLSFGEDKDKCCFVLDIDLGVKILGILVILSAASQCAWALSLLFRVFIINSTIFLGSAALSALAAYQFVLFFKDMDNKDAKAGLPKAMIYLGINIVAVNIWVLVFITLPLLGTFAFGALMQMVIGTCISLLFVAYYYNVCKRFAEQ